ncbi:hypothetical protein ROZALSC1DRAFT_28677 [Rozella allomycis CSF55]|uniref:Uncharacterized protein n=1 Tax=Rozella allomycis (strain CSF55) TaxID=988480 RepID=A0A4P9YJI4_ROZAC|nr:hypothetical protein ROZALSC1DRAFT_28677 [Rozella allomycis CSF55]
MHFISCSYLVVYLKPECPKIPVGEIANINSSLLRGMYMKLVRLGVLTSLLGVGLAELFDPFTFGRMDCVTMEATSNYNVEEICDTADTKDPDGNDVSIPSFLRVTSQQDFTQIGTGIKNTIYKSNYECKRPRKYMCKWFGSRPSCSPDPCSENEEYKLEMNPPLKAECQWSGAKRLFCKERPNWESKDFEERGKTCPK